MCGCTPQEVVVEQLHACSMDIMNLTQELDTALGRPIAMLSVINMLTCVGVSILAGIHKRAA